MSDRENISETLRIQWTALIEDELEDECPTPAQEVTIGILDEDISLTIDGSQCAEWDESKFSIPEAFAKTSFIGGQKLRITCKRHLFGLFKQFALELICSMRSGNNCMAATADALKEIRARIEAAKEPLSPDRQRGLIGELLVLEKAISYIGDSALSCWTGPEMDDPDRLRDFSGTRLQIEAKATSSRTGTVWINQINQLDYTGDYDLFLSVAIMFEDENGKTLHEFVDQVTSSLPSEESKRRFITKCTCAGYDRDAKYEYTHGIASHTFFRVDENSGILDPGKTEVGRNVGKIEYELNSSGLEKIEESEINWTDLTSSSDDN